MTKTQVEVTTSVERRRRWSRAEKERIVAASMEPGAVVSAVAHPCEPAVPLATGALRSDPCCAGLCSGDDRAGAGRSGEPGDDDLLRIEIDLLTGARLRISGAADAVTVSAAIMALTGRLSGDSPIPPQ